MCRTRRLVTSLRCSVFRSTWGTSSLKISEASSSRTGIAPIPFSSHCTAVRILVEGAPQWAGGVLDRVLPNWAASPGQSQTGRSLICTFPKQHPQPLQLI